MPSHLIYLAADDPAARQARHQAGVRLALSTQAAAMEPDLPPDGGGVESGYAQTLLWLLQQALPEAVCHRDPVQITVLASPLLGNADQRALLAWLREFGLTPLVLAPGQRLPLSQWYELVHSRATLVIGASLQPVADWLHAHTGIPDYRFNGLHDLAQCDRLQQLLTRLSGRLPSASQRLQRRQLCDTLLHSSTLSGVRLALALSADRLLAYLPLLRQVGLRLECTLLADTPSAHSGLLCPQTRHQLGCDHLLIGDSRHLAATLPLGADLLLSDQALCARQRGMPPPAPCGTLPQLELTMSRQGREVASLGYHGIAVLLQQWQQQFSQLALPSTSRGWIWPSAPRPVPRTLKPLR